MTKSLQAMLWALAIILVAIMATKEMVSESSATTLMLVLPMLASIQLAGDLKVRPCLWSKRA